MPTGGVPPLPPPTACGVPSLSSTAASSQCPSPTRPNIATGVSSPSRMTRNAASAVGAILSSPFRNGNPPATLNPSLESSYSGKFAGCSCLIRFHSDTFFGLAKSDADMNGLDKWKPANANKIRKHVSFMTGHIIGQMDEEEVEEVEGLGDIQHAGV